MRRDRRRRPAGDRAGAQRAGPRADAGDPRRHASGPASSSPRTPSSIPEPDREFTEEERSRRPTVFTALREIAAAFGCDDPHLGLYGAFGYDLAFQFEPVRLRLQRPAGQRDLVLHLPDEIWVLDRKREEAVRYSYEFEVGGDVDGRPRPPDGKHGRRRRTTVRSG